MSSETLDNLKSLHTSAIDARNGYDEALKDAEGKGMTPLFRDMIALHQQNSDELRDELVKHRQQADPDGSFMTTVHRTIMSVRSLFNGLDESVLPGLIDGEQRNLSKYDDVLAMPGLSKDLENDLRVQRGRIEKMIAEMVSHQASATQSS